MMIKIIIHKGIDCKNMFDISVGMMSNKSNTETKTIFLNDETRHPYTHTYNDKFNIIQCNKTEQNEEV